MTEKSVSPKRLRLGLIGDNIAQSRSPLLHRLAGEHNGVEVSYERLVPPALGVGFEQVLAHCAHSRYRGVNVTYPYKERAAELVRIENSLVRSIGAVNTVVFEGAGPVGHNTDYSGFKRAYRTARGERPPGSVLVIGTGGVGRAIAFALASLGALELRLLDRDSAKAENLARALDANVPNMATSVHGDLKSATVGVSGLVNCTPIGMTGHEGTPLNRALMSCAEWAFDAVYTPTDTQFLKDATAMGLSTISGWELFFHQGLDAWQYFADLPVNETELRRKLLKPGNDT